RGDEQADQDGDDGDDNEQLDERKARARSQERGTHENTLGKESGLSNDKMLIRCCSDPFMQGIRLDCDSPVLILRCPVGTVGGGRCAAACASCRSATEVGARAAGEDGVEEY